MDWILHRSKSDELIWKKGDGKLLYRTSFWSCILDTSQKTWEEEIMARWETMEKPHYRSQTPSRFCIAEGPVQWSVAFAPPLLGLLAMVGWFRHSISAADMKFLQFPAKMKIDENCLRKTATAQWKLCNTWLFGQSFGRSFKDALVNSTLLKWSGDRQEICDNHVAKVNLLNISYTILLMEEIPNNHPGWC